MERLKVKLSPQGQEFLNNSHCSSLVRSVLNSIDTYSAEVLSEEESIVRVKLLDGTFPEECGDFESFAIHKAHVIIC